MDRTFAGAEKEIDMSWVHGGKHASRTETAGESLKFLVHFSLQSHSVLE